MKRSESLSEKHQAGGYFRQRTGENYRPPSSLKKARRK
jgi:hypothetical protein